MSEPIQLGVRVAADAVAKIDAAAERLKLSRAQVIEVLARLCADRLMLTVDLPDRIGVQPEPKRGPGRKPRSGTKNSNKKGR